MLDKGAICRTRQNPEGGFFFRIFLVPKKDGKFRPVVTLRPLNRCILYRHFKMEGIHIVRSSSPEERGLHDKDRLEGRVFCRPSPLLTSETPVIPMEGSSVRVFMSPVWSCPGSPALYKGAEASGRLPMEHGGSMCNLH